jgi:hypothetical protein
MIGKSAWRKEMPPLLQLLEQQLGYRVRGHEEVLGYPLYFVDFSAWKLRFAANTPVLWMRSADLGALKPPGRPARALLRRCVFAACWNARSSSWWMGQSAGCASTSATIWPRSWCSM